MQNFDFSPSGDYMTDPFASLDFSQEESSILRALQMYFPRFDRYTYNGLVPIGKTDLTQVQNTRTVVVTVERGLEVNPNPITQRGMVLRPVSSYFDRLSVTCRDYGFKFQFRDADRNFFYYEPGNRSKGGLVSQFGKRTAEGIADLWNGLTLRGILTHPNRTVYNSPGFTFDTPEINAGIAMPVSSIRSLSLRKSDRNLYDGFPGDDVLMITNAYQLDAIYKDPQRENTLKFTEAGMRMLHSKVATYDANVQFVRSQYNTLWNAGVYNAASNPSFGRVNIIAPVYANDGGSDFHNIQVGGNKNSPYIRVQPFGANQFPEGQVVTLHRSRADNNGVIPAKSWVENGVEYTWLKAFTTGVPGSVDFLDGHTWSGVVSYRDPAAGLLGFQRPVPWDFAQEIDPTTLFVNDLDNTGITSGVGSGIYGYVTQGRNVGFSVAFYGPKGQVMAIHKMPQLMFPLPSDDRQQLQRVSIVSIVGTNVWDPDHIEVFFHGTKSYSRDVNSVQY